MASEAVRGEKHRFMRLSAFNAELRSRRAPTNDFPGVRSAARRVGRLIATPLRMGCRILDLEGRRVRVTDLDEPIWAGMSPTRGDVLNYYLDVADELLAYLLRHPISGSVRRAEVVARWNFQRGGLPGLPSWVPRCRGWDDLRMQAVDCPLVDDRATLAQLVSAGWLSFHPWNASIDVPDRPDRMVFNLDPTEIGFREVRHAALLIRDLLARYHIKSWVKTSGGAGVHVLVPLKPMHGFSEVREAATFILRAARAREPKLFTGEVRPSRRRGRIRIEVERNRSGAALVGAFSMRAEAPLVSMPVEWQELEGPLYPEDFPLNRVRERLDTVGNPLASFFAEPQSIDLVLGRLRTRYRPRLVPAM